VTPDQFEGCSRKNFLPGKNLFLENADKFGIDNAQKVRESAQRTRASSLEFRIVDAGKETLYPAYARE
jgi:hypothetical protein